MNAKLKSLIWVFVQLSVLTGIGMIWLRAIKEQRVQRSESLAVKIYCGDPEQMLIEVADVYQWLNGFYKKDVRKIPVYQLNLKQLESFLTAQPLVEHADLYVDGKNRLHLDVHQRIPLVRVIDRDGGQYYLDGSGYRIPVSTKYAARVPVATGHLVPVSGKKLANKESLYYAGLLEVASAIRKDTFMHALIEQIDLDAQGEFTLIPKVGREKIVLGSSEIIEDKIERIKLFYRENMGRQGWNVYQLVNVKFKGQVIGKKITQES